MYSSLDGSLFALAVLSSPKWLFSPSVSTTTTDINPSHPISCRLLPNQPGAPSPQIPPTCSPSRSSALLRHDSLRRRGSMTIYGSADLSPPSPKFKSCPKSSGVIRQKRSTDTLPSGTYPCTRPEAKKDVDGVKRRKIWDHILERQLSPPKSCKSPSFLSPRLSPTVKLIGHFSDRCFVPGTK